MCRSTVVERLCTDVSKSVSNCQTSSPSGAPQREVYFMGLIDVLTQYDTRKKAAHAAKAVKHGVRLQDAVGRSSSFSMELLLESSVYIWHCFMCLTVCLYVLRRPELKFQRFTRNSMQNVLKSSSLRSLPSATAIFN